MKFLFLTIAALGFSFRPSYQLIKITYTVTNKVEFSFDSLKNVQHDPWMDSVVSNMIKKTRIVHQFDLSSALGDTYISKYRFVGNASIKIPASPGPYTYRNDQWFEDNLLVNPNMYTVSFKETEEKKMILGYECTKFQCKKNTSDSLQMTIWATRRLPSYINPSYRLTGFPYGILEVVHGDSTEVIQATDISITEVNRKKKITTQTL